MPLTESQRAAVAKYLNGAPDEIVGRPLWELHPYYRPQFLNERRKRNILQIDPEPIGDPEFS